MVDGREQTDATPFELGELFRDPIWREPLLAAMGDPGTYSLVLQAGAVTIGSIGQAAVQIHSAVLVGSGSSLGLAYPADGQVRVRTRDRTTAALEVQQSGLLQLRFGGSQRLDVWVFEDHRRGTPQGDQAGRQVYEFLRHNAAMAPTPAPGLNRSEDPKPLAAPAHSSSAPQPSGTSATQAPAASATAQMSDDDLLRKVARRLAATCERAAQLNGQCENAADEIERIYAFTEQPQHELSRRNFLSLAEKKEVDLSEQLTKLKLVATEANKLWDQLQFLAGTTRTEKLVKWLLDRNVMESTTFSSIMINRFFTTIDFGTDRYTFAAAQERLANAMRQASEQ